MLIAPGLPRSVGCLGEAEKSYKDEARAAQPILKETVSYMYVCMY